MYNNDDIVYRIHNISLATTLFRHRRIFVGVGFQFFRFNGFLLWKIWWQRADLMRKTFLYIFENMHISYIFNL